MKLITYTKLLLVSVMLLGMTSCQDEDETEYWLPGTWTGTVDGQDASFMFSKDRTGYMRIEGEDDGDFRWYFEDEKYWDAPSGTIILDFGGNDKACITGSYADRRSILGTYYSYYEDYLDGYYEEGRSLSLQRRGY